MTIRVFYSCPPCGLIKIGLDVPARGEEAIDVWMPATLQLIANDHRRRSPNCHPKELHDLMIPMTGADRIGGPTLQ